MIRKEKIVELAKSYAAKGFLCSESVLLAISDGLEIQNELIPKIATGFGAGICFSGSVCGAISGGIMALSLKFGRNVAEEQAVNLYRSGRKLLKKFEKEFGEVMCQELTGCDFTTEAGRKKYAEEKLWETKCRQYIESVTATVFDLTSEESLQTG